MENTNNYSFEKKVYCQFPMLHFQVNSEYNVGLRASDIKPRLDRYLREVVGDNELNQYFKNDTKSLDYKLFVEPTENKFFNIVKRKDAKNSYGTDIIIKEDIFYYGDINSLVTFDCKLKFICFQKGLSKIINDNISNFFLLNNFGVMQSKGYGSFTVEEYKNSLEEAQIKEIGKVLKDYTGNPVYCFKLTHNAKLSDFYSKVSKVIKNYYNILKHGNNFNNVFIRSYIYQYAHKNGMNNEKAMMKTFGISPNISKNGNNKISTYSRNDEFRYVRSVLGLASNIRYKASTYNNDTETVSIQSKNEDIKRIPSPIIFKIVGNVIFIFNYDVSNFILNQQFEFNNKKKSKTISSPSEFNVSELIAEYNSKYNSEYIKKLYGNGYLDEYIVREVKLDE